MLISAYLKKWSYIGLLCLISFSLKASAETYIRMNQVGYLPRDPKIAVVTSTDLLDGISFTVKDRNGKSLFQGCLSTDKGEYLNLPHHFRADFSRLKTRGLYEIHIGPHKSPLFSIDHNVFNNLTYSLLHFYRVQRCGNTNPLHHKSCHLLDATKIIGGPRNGQKINVTGGWHDAGDYTKFLNTTAYTTYLLLLAYETNPEVFSDQDGNKRSDILDEALIGLNWMIKMHYQPDRLLIQVQNKKDQTVGWRLPEKDPLEIERPTYDRPSKAHCGLFSATMALAANIFKKINKNYADLCMKHARQTYFLAKTSIPETSVGPDSVYFDRNSWDNLALGAIELYRTTE